MNVDIDVLATAKITELNDSIIYALTIEAKNARNLSLQFNEFNLSPGAILSLFTSHELTDSITASQNNQNRVWATRVYQGSTIGVVLKIPKREEGLSSLRINKVNFGYKRFGQEFGNPGVSQGCNINVVCPQGNGWENERNSVAIVISGGFESCTGALVMNTCGTNIPYFLTADHCLDGNVQNWVFQFQTWSNTCTGNNGWREDVQFNGCQLRANSAASDFALLQLNQTPAANSGINYAGWSRETTGITQTTILHHPAGDLMKISRDNDAPTTTTVSGVSAWQLGLDLGATEGGTSGAPYFNQAHRIVAQHYGTGQTNLGVCQRTIKYGGRFDLSWTGGGTASTRLSNWLDPSNSGALTTNTTNVSNLFTPVAHGSFLPITGSSVVCGNSETYSVTGVLPGATVSWALSGAYANGSYFPLQDVCTLTPNGTQAILTKTNNGTVTLNATITNCDGRIQYASIPVTFGVPEIYVNGRYFIDNLYNTQPLDGSATFVNSSSFYLTFESSGNNTYTWNYEGGSGNDNYNTSYPATFGYIWWNTPIEPYDYNGFTIHTTNACGTRNDPMYLYYDGPYQYYRVAPNPVRSTLNIQLRDRKQNSIPQGKKNLNVDITRIVIVDKTGNPVLDKTYPSNTRSANLNVSMLKPDVYIVRIFSRDKMEIHKIMVQN